MMDVSFSEHHNGGQDFNAASSSTNNLPYLSEAFHSGQPSWNEANTQSALLSVVIEEAANQIEKFSRSPQFLEDLRQIFGEEINLSVATQVFQDFIQGEIRPEIKILDVDQLGVQGAFGQDTVYLADSLLDPNRSSLKQAVTVFQEEVGHYFDTLLNPHGDAAGDEGAIFAKTVQNQALSDAELAILKAENDHDTLILGGQAIAIEKYSEVLDWNLDVDGDGLTTSNSDGLMVVRYLFGSVFAGDALTNNAISPDATRTPEEIRDYIRQGVNLGALDVDGDGKANALTDGVLIMRYLLGSGFLGDALTEGATALAATRTTAEIRDYLGNLADLTAINLSLTNDTGSSASDGITHNPEITGQLVLSQLVRDFADVQLFASFASKETTTDITSFMNEEGEFSLSQQDLETIFGSSLIDREYKLIVRAVTLDGTPLAAQPFTFVLDTAAPELDLESPISEGIYSPEGRLIGSLSDDSDIASATYQLNGGTVEAIALNQNNRFDERLSDEVKEHQLQITVTDIAGNQTTQTIDFSVWQGWTLDVDGDGTINPDSDGLMIVRYLFGSIFAGDALTDNAISPDATRTTEEIRTYIQQGIELGALDVDGDGLVNPYSDAVILLRYLSADSAFAGDALTDNASSPNATRTAEEIREHLATLTDLGLTSSLSVSLANDTGSNDGDSITSNPAITGQLSTVLTDIRLMGTFAGQDTATDITQFVNDDGLFSLSQQDLEVVFGSGLIDGDYQLTLKAINTAGIQLATSSLSFTVDQTGPVLRLDSPVVEGTHGLEGRLVGSVADDADIASATYQLDGGNVETLVLDEAGRFNLPLSVAEGLHQLQVIVTDIAGNQTSQTLDFSAAANTGITQPDGSDGWYGKTDNSVVLGEENSLVSEAFLSVTLGQAEGSRTLSFDVQALFDTSSDGALGDRLLVYLVDAANPGQTLLDMGVAGTPIFILGETGAEFQPGLVRYNGNTVEIDTTAITDTTAGRLVFQLLNFDGDTGSVIRVDGLENTLDEAGQASPSAPVERVVAEVGEAIALDTLTPSPDLKAIFKQVRFDSATGTYRADLQITNTGTDKLSRRTAIRFSNLPDGVELQGISGTDSAGNPYINLENAIASGGLKPNGTSDVIEVIITNPNFVPIDWQLEILSNGVNQAPILETIPELTVQPGTPFAFNFAASDTDGDAIQYFLRTDEKLPTGLLKGDGVLTLTATPEEVGTYTFDVVATDGVNETTQTVTLTVVEDSIKTTRISGILENITEEPLAGVVVTLGSIETTTDAEGRFLLEVPEGEALPSDTLKIYADALTGDQVYPFLAEKLNLTLGHEPFLGVENVIERPIYLPALDIANGQTIDPAAETIVTTDAIAGAAVTVPAGSLLDQEGQPFTETLSITEVPLELTPLALPPHLSPDLVVTIQPGEMVFTTPAPLTLPNRAGYAPGMLMDLWSIDPDTGDFDKVGVAQVSADGSVIETIEGGIVNSSWHFVSPPPPPPVAPVTGSAIASAVGSDAAAFNEHNCSEPFNSTVDLSSGTIMESHDLTTYQSLGVSRGVQLRYDSLRADSRHIVQFGFSNFDPRAQNPTRTNDLRLMADLTVHIDGLDYQIPGFAGGEFGLEGGEHFWSMTSAVGDVNASLQADLREFESGVYDYSLNTGIRLFNLGRFLGSSTTTEGRIVHINEQDSVFGAGWGIAGVQKLVENSDGSLLLIDGDGSELLFGVPTDNIYDSPPGDFSTVEKLADGTFRRTMKDQMVYQFDAQNRLISATDRNGNQTQHIYQNDLLTKIVDPVGLETIFSYTNGKVTGITDPANRTTQLVYDAAGNLTKIIDPDQSQRTFGYDDQHHMTSEIDQRGNREETTYDFAGRAIRSLQKDGSIIQVETAQTKGLHKAELTSSPFNSPLAYRDDRDTASYSDQDGNTSATTLDSAGQVITSTDGHGNTGSIERDENNLIVRQTDAEGNITNFTYDSVGNLTEYSDKVGRLSIRKAEINLRTLDGSDGFIISGFPETNHFNSTVNSAGDINGDGIDDLIFSAPNATYEKLETHVVFGRNDGFGSNFDVGSLDGSNGFSISNPKLFGSVGIAVSSAGDVNGDGLDDLLIGAPSISGNSVFPISGGQSYVIFGRTSGFEANFDLNTLDGNNGFSLSGAEPSDLSGSSLDGIGDINGDGVDDFIIGAVGANQNNGASYVVFGRGSGFAANINLGALDGNNGFTISGTNPNDQIGRSVSGVGDVNGDGLDDFVLGASGVGRRGESYVIFGRTSGFGDNLDLNTLDGNNGFTITPTSSIFNGTFGASVSGAGDVNGDGFDDLIVGAPKVPTSYGINIGHSYVIFGRASRFAANFNVSTLDGNNGFVISGTNQSERVGVLVSNAGDVNNDGFDDLIIATTLPYSSDDTNTAQSYVMFGQSDGFDSNFDLSEIDGDNGFILHGINPGISGLRVLDNHYVSGAGDINNDGVDDLIIGSHSQVYSPELNDADNIEQVYVVFGIGKSTSTGRESQLFTYETTFNQITSYTNELYQQTLFDIDSTNGNIRSETRVVGEVGGDDDQVTTYTYTSSGLVDLMTDPLGRVTDYNYDAFGRLTQVIFAKGTSDQATQKFEYDAAGNQEAFIDENDNRTEYVYDELNRLVQIIAADPDGEGELESSITKFIYDAAGNVARIDDARGNSTNFEYDVQNRQTSITDALLGVMEYEYDNSGNVIATTDERGNVTQLRYDSRDRLTETIDPEGGKTRFRYDGNNNLIALEELLDDGTFRRTMFGYDSRDRLTREVDADGNETFYEYDAANNLTAVVDRNGNRTEFRYDELNRLIETEDALEHVSSQTYDLANNLISSTDELGRTMTYQYDNRNRLTKINHPTPFQAESISYAYDAVGNLLSVTDELGRTISYGYDGLNRQISMLDPLGYQTQYQYDANDNLTAVIDALGRTTRFTYDKLNRQRTRIDALGGIATTAYDASGNITSVTDELNRTTTFDYDSRHLLTKITDPLGHISTTTYDILGRAISNTDALGNTTTNRYDNLDRLLETEDATGAVTKYAYDAVGNLESITDAGQNETTFAYDKLNRLEARTTNSGSETFKYDAVGNQIQTTNRNEKVRRFDYDARDRLTDEYWLDESEDIIYQAEYDYNAASELTRARDNYSTYSYEYDLNGRLTEVDNEGTPNIPHVVFNYDYNAVGDRLSVTDSSNGQQNGIETFNYDDLSRVVSITQTGNNVTDKRVDFSYNAASQMTEINRFSNLRGNNVVANSTYSFDSAGRLKELNHLKDGNSLAFYRFDYDDANRLTRFESRDGISNFDYNDRDELTSADHSFQDDETYSYDDQGNRTNDGYFYGDENRLGQDSNYGYNYDDEGNRTFDVVLEPFGEHLRYDFNTYEWDHLNRLISITSGNVASNTITKYVEYTYDIYGRRILKVVDSDGDGENPAVTEAFVYDGEHIALVFDGDGNQTHRYLHGPQIDQVIAEETADGEVRWALTDHLGSVRDVIDNDGVAVDHIVYDSFGNITSDGEVSFRFSYTGREYDPESGQYFYRARYYDAAIGRFINEDTIGFAGGDTNLFRYVGNSPLNYIDPSGNEAISFIVFTVVGGYAAGQLLFPNPAQTPTEPCDIDHTDNSNKQAVVEIVVGAGVEKAVSKGAVNAAKGLVKLADDAINSADELVTSLLKGESRDLVPVIGDLGESLADDAVTALGDDVSREIGLRAGAGNAADELFQPYFAANDGSGNLGGAAERLGVNLDRVPIQDGVAKAKIDISSELNPRDIRELKNVLKARGATKVEVETGHLANTKLDLFLRRRVEDGRAFHGGIVKYSNSPDSDFVIEFML